MIFNENNMVRVVVADDHALLREGVKQVISMTGEMSVVGEAMHAAEVVDVIRNKSCDVLLLDLNMPGSSGVDLIGRLRLEKPSLPILVFSMYDDVQIVLRALKAGAAGYVTKGSDVGVLLAALRKLAAGDRFIDPCLVNQLVFEPTARNDHPHQALSNREYQVLQLLVRGKSTTQMAENLQLSAKTISTHKAHIKDKLGLHSDADVIRYALEHRL